MPTEAAAPKKRRLVHVRELDGIRGIAAIVVFFHHVCFTSVPLAGWGPGIRRLSALSIYGVFGVDIFFVLSGFLITSLLIEDRESEHYYWNFYWKRALRILPLYLICLVGVYFFVPDSHTYVLMSAFFVANFGTALHINNPGPFWTLAIEEQFYLLWPTVVRGRSIDSIRRWAVRVGVGCVIARLIAACFGHENFQFTFFHCDGLAAGAWLACRFEKEGRLVFHSWKEKVGTGAVVVGASMLFFLPSALPPGPRIGAFGVAMVFTAVTMLGGSLTAFVLAHHGKPYLSPFRSPILTFFGLISYAFYMVHLYVLRLYDHVRGPLVPGDLEMYWVRFGTILSVTVAISLVSRYVLELPAASLRKYVLR